MEPQDQPSRLHPGPGLTPTPVQGHRSGHAEHFSSSIGTGAMSDHNSQESEPLSNLHKLAPANSTTPTSHNIATPPGLTAGRPLPSSSLPNSPPPSPLPPRLAGTPPTNPPPRFFTRPYRRPLDHNHTHHGSVHGPGHGNGQNSSSIGVRSAFKDFVVPAQIILVCSILNVLWPTLLRIVTTTLEFLVLVLSSYYACARRSDDCYFLEPLLNDGQEAIYVGTIQWTLRTVFLVLFLSGLIFTGKKIERIWSTLVSNRQRPRSFWSPDNIWGWLMTYPNAGWVYLERIIPWKVARSAQTRSGAGQRHLRKASSTPSPASRHQDQLHSTSPKDRAASALSSGFGHIYSRKMAPSSSAVDTDAYSAGSGSEARPKSKSKKKSKNTEENHQQQHQLHKDTANIEVPIIISNGATPSGNCPESTTTRPAEASVSSSKTTSMERTADAATAASNAVYETADDDDFISTQDRRRRKRAQRVSSASALIESLPKSSTTSKETEPKSTRISESTSSSSLTSNTSKETTQSALPPTGSHLGEQHLPTVQQSGQPLTPAKAAKESKATVTTPPTQPAKKKDVSFNTQEATFQHPIHALNSTSQIVRLKPTHKRSQSAQLPSLSAWSAQSGTSHTKAGQSSAANQVTHPTETTSEDSRKSPAASSGNASNSTESKGYDLFGQSSIWYSPFQSGLDITIESDHEHGKHGSRSLARPRIQIGSPSTGKSNRPSLGFLPASSFFESSPRTPRIMPFSQHHSNRSPGFGLEDWSVRTRSSSIASPLTPLLETDCADPMDYFGGSRSASNSRRGSVENNLTESLLSGRARMFASSGLDTSSSQGSEQLSLTRSHQHSLSDGNFLSPQFSTSVMPTGLTTQSPLDTQTLGTSSLTSHHLPPTSTSSSPFLPVDDDADVAPVFVNPWESNYPYRSTHTMSETFLPFSTTTLPPLPESSVPSDEQDRQTSLLSLMNSSANSSRPASARGSFDIGSNLASFEPSGSSSMNEDEKAAIRRGFMFPNIGAMALGPTDNPAFRPFASLEMSLAAAANQPPPLTTEPHYDSVELTMKDFPARRRGPKYDDSGRAESGEKRPKERHRRARSGHHKSASLGSFFPPMPPPSGMSENATPGIQDNSSGTLDPLSRLPNHQGHGPSKLGRHHHHSTGGSGSKEGDLNGHGSSSSSNRRRATGASDHEGHYRGGGSGGGSGRHHHRQESATAKPKKKPVSPE